MNFNNNHGLNVETYALLLKKIQASSSTTDRKIGNLANLETTDKSNLVEAINEIVEGTVGGVHYIGITTTAITDGATINPITIRGESVTATQGDMVSYSSGEFIFNGSVWNEIGDLTGLGDLAYKDTASTTYTPTGANSVPTFTGSPVNVSVSGTATGTNSVPTFTGTEGNVSVSGTATGTVSQPTTTISPTTTTVNSITDVGSFTYDSADESITLVLPTKGADTTVMTGATATTSQPTFTGTAFNSTGKFTPNGTVSAPVFTGTAFTSTGSVTAEGTVSAPVFTGDEATVTVS